MKQLIVCTFVIFALAFVSSASATKRLNLDSDITHFNEEQAKELFLDFIAYHGKNYGSETEHSHRYKAFADNLQYIAKHNKEAAKGKHTYTLGLNPLADLTFEEYTQQYLTGLNINNRTNGDDDDDDNFRGDDDDDDNFRVPFEMVDPANAPAAIDWRTLGYVGPVQNQGACGSCWAFSTISMIEGAWRQSGRVYTDLSEQQLVDCVAGGSYTCSTGGNMRAAAADVISRGGVQSEPSYPYCTCSGRGCKFNKALVAASIKSYAAVPATEDALVNAASTRSSVSVAIDAGSRDFQLYRSGTFSGPCGTSLNHAVNVVGYTSSYLIVRNSWGAGWGSAGYVNMARGRNLCGINNYCTVVYA